MVTRKESRDTFLGFGTDGDQNKCNDVYKLRIDDNNVATWTKMESDGKGPSPRYFLSASVMSTGDILIHGGSPSNSECWKAKIDSNKIIWEQLESTGEDRNGHSSESIGSHVIFIGGYNCKSTLAQNEVTKEWLKPAEPINLYYHKTFVYNQQIQAFGGQDNNTRVMTNEVIKLNLEKMFGDGDFEHLLKARQSCNKISKYHKMKYHLLRYISEQGNYFD